MDDFTIQIVLADDHPAIISGLLHTLKKHRTVNVVGSAANSTELIAQLAAHRCDVLVSDYAMPGGDYGDGITLFSFLRRRYPETRIVVLTMIDNAGVIRALLKLGIECILSKADATDHLLAAVHGAYANGRYFSPTIAKVVWQIDIEQPATSARELTSREAEVVRLFVSGMSINEIAAHLKRSKQTISSQKNNAMRKLGIERDTDLIKYSIGASLAAPGTELPAEPPADA
ncbi:MULTISPECIES: response regulator transcription factor [unclassified Burkholderia]|uniref:response regulator transcription factor n=1 Tax=unclassified Burkholderia TaxID=2613784 RepID=UPI000908999D|nr:MULTISPECIES: response regulator transcription factor [unclassified Burkholderia]SFW90602.1 two component transcriptional regulator, LuxR family [Burkholderia sp. NFACC33-1]SFY46518.1 two component transcriptional regulator, LuxR family [Burkholderia sp. NFPP32]